VNSHLDDILQSNSREDMDDNDNDNNNNNNYNNNDVSINGENGLIKPILVNKGDSQWTDQEESACETSLHNYLSSPRILMYYPLVFGLIWSLSFVTVLLSFWSIQPFGVKFIRGISLPAQGFVCAIVYAIERRSWASDSNRLLYLDELDKRQKNKRLLRLRTTGSTKRVRFDPKVETIRQ